MNLLHVGSICAITCEGVTKSSNNMEIGHASAKEKASCQAKSEENRVKGCSRAGFQAESQIKGRKKMIAAPDLRDCVIVPVLSHLAKIEPLMESKAAVNLLLGIAAVETTGGSFLRQRGDGPALGIYQVEPETHLDIYQSYLNRKMELREAVLKLASRVNGPTHAAARNADLTANLLYATAIARVILWRVPDPLPDSGDIWALAAYWKKHWNTSKGKGTLDHFVDAYESYVR